MKCRKCKEDTPVERMPKHPNGAIKELICTKCQTERMKMNRERKRIAA